MVGERDKVSAFEPVPSTYKLLHKHTELNGFKQVQTFYFALGNKNGIVQIYSENEKRGGASIINHQSSLGEKIEVKRLDDVLANQKIESIKFDIEGFEFEVLKGAENVIKNQRPVLIDEYSLERENTANKNEIFEWIQSFVFENL